MENPKYPDAESIKKMEPVRKVWKHFVDEFPTSTLKESSWGHFWDQFSEPLQDAGVVLVLSPRRILADPERFADFALNLMIQHQQDARRAHLQQANEVAA